MAPARSSSKAGPSRLRMKEKAGTGERTKSGTKDDDEDDGEEGGLEEMDLRHRYDSDIQESDEDDMETPAEAKVRLAKQYLEGLRGEEVGEYLTALEYRLGTLLNIFIY